MKAMTGSYGTRVLGLVCLLALAGVCTGTAHAQKRTALDRYVAKPDTNFAWTVVNSVKGEGVTTHIVDMTSQSWLTTNEVNRTLWKHWVVIVRPDDVTTTKALLFIGGGGNDRPAPKGADENIVKIAKATRSVVAELRMVPNQPLTFKGQTAGQHEDGLIAYTWDKFLRTGDERWPARLPMTKSAVRAMDTVSAFCASADGGKTKVDQFVVAGGSKRGWTAWTTAAVDKRVIAVVPIVIDMLNIVPSFEHHFAAYGFWAPAVGDYTALNIMDWSGSEPYKQLMRIEEPYEYRDRLTMPKFIINSAGDQFFLPDSAQYYFKDLKGVKYLRYVPNSDHSLKGSDAWLTLMACYHAILTSSSLPQFGWTVDSPGQMTVQTKTSPKEVKLWTANNPKARDFRLEALGPKYEPTVLKESSPGTYVAAVAKPLSGWTAYFVELTFPGPGPAPFKFTTEVRVVPDTLPFNPPKPNRPK